MPMVGMGLCCRESAKGNAVRQGVLDFLLLGGRLLDDAQKYGNQYEVGKGIRQAMELGVPRGEIFVTTKISHDRFGFERTAWWVKNMLLELGLEYVDLVLLHQAGVHVEDHLNAFNVGCRGPKECRQETWTALQRAHRAGQIRHLGVSNFGPRQMQELVEMGGAPIAVNEIEYHPWVPQVYRTTAEWCHQHGIAVTAYGSIRRPRSTSPLLTQGVLTQMASSYDKTVSQVLLPGLFRRMSV